MIKESTSVIITSIFEATEAFTPTFFVILANELPEPAERTEDPDVSTLAKMEDWMESALELTGKQRRADRRSSTSRQKSFQRGL